MNENLIYKPLEEIHTKTGTEYSIGYYCKDANDFNSVNQLVGETARFSPVSGRITQARKVSIIGTQTYPCYLDLFCNPNDATDTREDNFSTKVLRSYSLGEFAFNPDHFGVRKSDGTDETDGVLDIDGAKCGKESLVYKNANIGANKGLIGHADSSMSPFTWGGSIDALRIKSCLNGRPHKCNVLEVQYYSKSSPSSIVGSNSYMPSGGLVVWTLKSQDIKEVLDNKGNIWTSVFKQYMQVPYTWMKWS